MRLLTDEEIQRFKLEANRRANDLQQSTEGHFKQEDIEGIYLEADKAMVKEQDTRALKAVGGWLRKRKIIYSTYAHIRLGINVKEVEIAAFENGEMPEEGKGFTEEESKDLRHNASDDTIG